MCVCVCVCVCARARGRACACVRARASRESERKRLRQCRHCVSSEVRQALSTPSSYGKSNQLAPFSRSAELPDAAPIQNCHKDIQELPSLFFLPSAHNFLCPYTNNPNHPNTHTMAKLATHSISPVPPLVDKCQRPRRGVPSQPYNSSTSQGNREWTRPWHGLAVVRLTSPIPQ